MSGFDGQRGLQLAVEMNDADIPLYSFRPPNPTAIHCCVLYTDQDKVQAYIEHRQRVIQTKVYIVPKNSHGPSRPRGTVLTGVETSGDCERGCEDGSQVIEMG